jgi:hypothetical protein
MQQRRRDMLAQPAKGAVLMLNDLLEGQWH